MHIHSPNKPKKKLKNAIWQKADGNCSPGQERSADGGLRAARDHNNVRSVLQSTK
jgi:hypothetical protein